MEDFNPMLDGLEDLEEVEVKELPEVVFIDPFAPPGPHPGIVIIPVCDLCSLMHPDTSKYLCPCGKELCSSQTRYKYKGNDYSIVDTVPYVDQAVEYSISPCCKVKVEKIN